MTLSDATNTYTAYVGLKEVISGVPANGIFFRYTNAVNGGRWQAVCRASGVETAVDTGVSPGTTGAETLEIRGSSDGLTFTFFINDTLVATITTNLPAINVGFGAGINFLRSVGTAAVNAAAYDYMVLEQDSPSRT